MDPVTSDCSVGEHHAGARHILPLLCGQHGQHQPRPARHRQELPPGLQLHPGGLRQPSGWEP